MNDVDATIARRMRDLRGGAVLTQQDLADRLNDRGHRWSRTTVAKVENGTRSLTASEFLAVAEALGASPLALAATSAAPRRLHIHTNSDPRLILEAIQRYWDKHDDPENDTTTEEP